MLILSKYRRFLMRLPFCYTHPQPAAQNHVKTAVGERTMAQFTDILVEATVIFTAQTFSPYHL
jgi:hypothetical protein